MIRILHIISSHKGDWSISYKLGKGIIQHIKRKESGDVTVEELDLISESFPHFTSTSWNAFQAPVHKLSEEEADVAYRSDQAVRQLLRSDVIIVSAPMHNYGVPSALKAYLDHVVRAGITFGFTESGPVGLFDHKKAYIAFSAGWNFSHPSLKPYDFVSPYLRAVLRLIGFEIAGEYRVEGVKNPMEKDAKLAQVIKSIEI